MMKSLSKYCLVFALLLLTQLAKAQTASINAVEPNRGYAGQVVSIKGVGLAGANTVLFGGVKGTIISVSDQLIEAEVPAGATFDNVSVLNTTSRLTFYSNERFLLSYGGDSGVSASDFDAQIDELAGSGLYDVVVTDLDGDSKNDLVGASTKTNLATLIRNTSTPGNITFGAKVSFDLASPSLNVTAGDLNGDGLPELVFTSDGDDRVMVLVNSSSTGNLSFTLRSLTIAGASTKRAVIKDLDLDGKPDLIVSDQNNPKIYLLENTTTGGILSFDNDVIELDVANASSTSGLEVEDLNGDGKPEIITNQFLTDGGGFYVATNQSNSGNFSFTAFTQFQSTGTFVNVKVGDVNEDGKPDIVATLFLSSSVSVFLNQTASSGGSPDFGSAQSVTTDVRPWGLDFGDMDGDGQKDIVVTTIGDDLAVNVLNKTGGGATDFSKVTVPVTFINRNIKVADIDGDSKPDIVFTSVDDEANGINSSNISILRNNQCIKPIITPEGPITVCDGNTVRLEAQKIAGATYDWQRDGSVEKTGSDNFVEISDASGNGDWTVSIISEGGACTDISDPVTVSIISAATLPSAVISQNGPVCIGENLQLSSTDVGASSYVWRGPNGFTAFGRNVSVTDFTLDDVGRYFLYVYTGTPDSCLIETQSVVVSAINAPNFAIRQSGSGTYCIGDPVTLTLSPNDPDYDYQWFEGNTPIAGATGTTFTPTTSGTYHAEASDQINTTCTDIVTAPLEVNFLDIIQVEFSAPTGECSGGSVSFTDESIISAEGNPTFLWDFGDGNTSTEQNPTHVYAEAGTFSVRLEITYNDDGEELCSYNSAQFVEVEGVLDVAINPSVSAICDGDSSVLSVDDIYSSYEWNTGQTGPSITVEEGGDYSVTVIDGNGCEGFGEISIGESAAPNVEIDASSTIVSPGDTITLTASSGLADYVWSPDSLLITAPGDQVQMVVNESITVTVNGENSSGCFGEASVDILVEEADIGSIIKPMKFFSPNGDAIAQFWEIEEIENFDQCGVEIYDQEGNLIYSAKPYENDWDGTRNGQDVPDGVYYFVVRCDGSEVAKSGSITLLR